jgi:WD40 repeat protein
VSYEERRLEGIILIEEDRKVRRIASEESDWGLTGPPQGHWDLISSIQVLQQNEKLLLSSSRDGVIKVWK